MDRATTREGLFFLQFILDSHQKKKKKMYDIYSVACLGVFFFFLFASSSILYTMFA